MIVVVTTATHAYTHAAITKRLPPLRQMSYPALLRRRTLLRATYVFTDFDRLGFWQLELAAHVYRVLRDAGCRVLNDPAAVLQRLPLLRRLHAAGINSFNAWPADELDAVDRYPVFLRTRAAHRGVLTALLPDAAALAEACRGLVAQGHPLGDLMAVEYRAEPLHGDIFRKLSVFRIGDAIIPVAGVHERSWVAKHGENGVAGAEAYEQELETIRANAYAAPARRVFDTAQVEYGRADFGVVGGREEFYEINTNPNFQLDGPAAASPARAESLRITRVMLLEALAALDTGSGARIAIPPHREFDRRGRRRMLWPGHSWLP